MAFGSRTVAQRDVNFNVNLGQFRAELGEAQATYARSTGAMSTEALKLSVAEERVARAIKLHGATSIQARNATVAYRREVQGLTTSTIVSRDALLSEERALGRFTRGAIAGSGAARGLGRSLAFSSAAFLGAAGLVYALRASVKAADAHEVALEQLKVALHNGGLSWQQYGAAIDVALNRQVRATAFSKEDLTTTLAANIRRFGDVTQALKANSLEADVARAKNISLADAFNLISRASFGQPRSLRQLQIELTKTTANMDALKATTKHASAEQIANAKAADLQANETAALAAVQEKYHGNAAKFLTTAAGKQALFAAELKLTEEIIGTALLPELNKLLGGLSGYLEKLNRTGQLQRDARRAARDLSLAIKGVRDAFHLVGEVVGPVNKALGGVRHSAELLTLALVAYKLRGVASFVTGSKAVEVAAVQSAATVEASAAAQTTALAGATTEVAALRTGLLGLGALSLAPIVIPLEISVLNADKGVLQKLFGKTAGKLLSDATKLTVPGEIPGAVVDAYNTLTGGGKKPATAAGGTGAAADAAAKARHGAGLAPHGGAGGGGSSGGGGGGQGGLVLGLTNAQETALLIAQGTPGTGDDEKALKAQLGIYNRLLAQKGLNAGQRNDLLSGRNSVTDQLAAIASADSATAKASADKAAAARRKAQAEATAARRKRIAGLEQAPAALRIAVETAIANNAGETRLLTLYREERAAIEKQVVELRRIGAGKDAILKARTTEAAIQKHINDILKKKKQAGSGVQAEAFLNELTGIAADYASNVTGKGKHVGTGSTSGTTVVLNVNHPAVPWTLLRQAREAARHVIP